MRMEEERKGTEEENDGGERRLEYWEEKDLII
jgi:hypothetical protein